MNDSGVALALSGITFLLTLIWGKPLIRVLRHYDIGDLSAEDSRPIMGGWLITVPVILVTVLLNMSTFLVFDGVGRSILYPLAALFAFGIVGTVFDWRLARRETSDQISPRIRLRRLSITGPNSLPAPTGFSSGLTPPCAARNPRSTASRAWSCPLIRSASRSLSVNSAAA